MTNMDYSKEMAKMVGSNEFSRLLGPDANKKIMKYSEVKSVNDLNDLLLPQDYRIILIETKNDSTTENRNEAN